MSLDLDIHELRSKGMSFSIIGARLGLTKDQAQKRYQKFLLSSPLPHTPSPVSTSSEGGLVKNVLTPPTPPSDSQYIRPTDVVHLDYVQRICERRETMNVLVVAAGVFQFTFEDP